MAIIQGANVGGSVAGGAIIPEPVIPSYATWPEIAKKTFQDFTALWLENQKSRSQRETEQRAGVERENGPTPARTAAIFGLPVLVFIGLLFLLLQRGTILGRIF